jgi:hypothetical protein
MIGLFTIAIWPSAAIADCGYSRNVLAQYLATCAQQDGCQYADKMKTLVAEACGERVAAENRPIATPVAPPPHAVAEPDEPNSPERPPAESPTTMPANTPATASLPPHEDHSGKPCRYFTGRPAVERDDQSVRMNYYEEGSTVCYGERYYACTNGRWRVHQQGCPTGAKHAEDLEN